MGAMVAALGLKAGLAPPVVAQHGHAPGNPAPSPTTSAASSAAPNVPPVAKHKCMSGMVPIPAGTFTMGDDENKEKAGQVTVAAFCMDRTEVTAAAYEACVTAGTCTATYTGPYNGHDEFCNEGAAGRKNHPINCIDLDQAEAYCRAKGRRLPTEEEWEYAARGTDGRLYPWGNKAPSNQLCWNGEGNSKGKGNRKSTCAVGSHAKGRSPFGLEDMAGNSAEWTSSSDGSAVPRGGSWGFDEPASVRAAHRGWYFAAADNLVMGFRCAASVAVP